VFQVNGVQRSLIAAESLFDFSHFSFEDKKGTITGWQKHSVAGHNLQTNASLQVSGARKKFKNKEDKKIWMWDYSEEPLMLGFLFFSFTKIWVWDYYEELCRDFSSLWGKACLSTFACATNPRNGESLTLLTNDFKYRESERPVQRRVNRQQLRRGHLFTSLLI
jgi:hypothetical protein